MNTNESTVTLHVVSSLDGFIARKDNTVSWMDSPDGVYEKGVSEGDAVDAIEPIDCFVLGSLTYEHALELGWPYDDITTFVLTSRQMSSTRKSVQFYSGDIKRLVDEILTPRYRNIWVVGGAVLSQSFLRMGLVDEIRLTIAPVLLGGGLRLFNDFGEETQWQLKDVVAYKNGFVALAYGRPSAKA